VTPRELDAHAALFLNDKKIKKREIYYCNYACFRGMVSLLLFLIRF